MVNDEEALKIIDSYISDRTYNYAVMINGEWGCGKTYFVKNVLKDHLIDNSNVDNKKKKKGVIYISLYGLESLTDISNQVFVNMASIRTDNKCIKTIRRWSKRTEPIKDLGISVAACIVPQLGSLKDIKLKNAIGRMKSMSNFIFIFDDLERCSIQINEVLGYINNFVEQSNCKVIVVANEKEIGKTSNNKNIESKYQLALSDNIKYPSQNVDASKKDQTIDIAEIRERVKYLFSENEIYVLTKEKLIGRTILYQPDIKQVVANLIDAICQESFFYTNLIKSKDYIVDILEKNNCYNIRTIQFCLVFIERIGKLEDDSIKSISKKNLEVILQDIFRVAIEHKNGTKKYVFNDSDFGNIKNEKNPFCTVQSFRFTYDYIYDATFSGEYIAEVLNKFVESVNERERQTTDPINILEGYWGMENDEIETAIDSLIINLKNNEYDASKYKRILSLLYKIKDLESSLVDVDEIVKQMIRNLADKAESINSFEHFAIPSDSEYYDQFLMNIRRLENTSKSKSKDKRATEINSYFSSEEGWGEKFLEFCRREKVALLNEGDFVSFFEIPKVIKLLSNCHARDVLNFVYAFNIIYNYDSLKSIYRNDLDKLKMLKGEVNQIETESFSKKMQLALFSKKLGDIINKLE